MNMRLICQRTAGALLLIFAATPGPSASGARLVDETFQVLQTKTGTYTNVTVTTKAADYIFILHTNGMASVKLQDLPVEIRRELGYAAGDAPKLQKTNPIASVAARELTQVNRNLKPMEQAWKQKWQSRRAALRINSEVLFTLLAFALLFYLFLCYCCHLICLKAKSPASFLEWVPGLQLIPLLRAAGMSGWCFLAFCVPLLNIVAGVLLSLNIVKAREKNVVWAILLMLPGLNLLAFLYLAFSSGPSDEKTPTKFQTKAFQTAGA
jgi:hypothetical protein